MKRNILLSLLLLLSLLCLSACGEEAALEPIQAGEAARELSITQTDGTEFVLSAQQGKVVLLNFWATWCGPCMMEMPAFDMLREEYGEELSILAISIDDDVAAAETYLEEQGYGFPTALDPEQETLAVYPTDGFPTSVLIDQEGNVVEVILGGGPADQVFENFKSLIDPLL